MELYAKEPDAAAAPQDVLPPIDAVIRVLVPASQLEAYLNIDPPENGGAAPTLEAMMEALARAGVTHNINEERLRQIAGTPSYQFDLLVASATLPVNGKDGVAEFLINTEKKNFKPKENEDGSVDFYDLGIVENVARNQVLCRITPPTEGTPGISVKGKELPQKRGRAVSNLVGKNTELSEDGAEIRSKIDGQVEFDGFKIRVDETFHVKENVDNSTGNISVVSNMMVSGMVQPGFKIEAGRDIDIMGMVTGATVRAGGGVRLRSGIIGSELHCDGDLQCRFIENCNVFVKGEIRAESVINSNVKCGKSIKIMGARARIIGGSCLAGNNIEAHTIGSPSNTATRLELGADHTVIEQQQKLAAQAAELEKQIKSLTPLVTILRQLEAENRLTPEKRKILDDVGYSYETNTARLEEIRQELENIAQAVKTRGFGRVICTGTIYPGTKLTIDKTVFFVRDTLRNATLYYKENEIVLGAAR